MLSRGEFLAGWSALHGGYDPGSSRVVRTWLALAYRLAVPLARMRVAPDALTYAGLLPPLVALAAAGAGGPWLLFAAAAVALTGVLDALDGAVAVLSRRTSSWGAVLDSVVDRCGDALFLVTLFVAGAPGWACVLAGVLTFLLEYARARAGCAGMREVGVVTAWERPARVVVVAMFLVAAGLLPSYGEPFLAVGCAVAVVLGVVAIGQLLIVVRRALT
ncbi:MAG: CDP-alcohol phosphatidyltransferase family protein [Actinomycetota bacterium]|nr:CDP-alcohol phosphatidyltransferase family protein [Actinomycetota bacterium]